MTFCGSGITLGCFKIALCGFGITLYDFGITLCGFGIKLRYVVLELNCLMLFWN